MKTVTLDTSILPRHRQRHEYEELIAEGRRRGFTFAAVFLTNREVHDTSFQEYLTPLEKIFTSGLVGNDAIPGEIVFAPEDFPDRFEEILSLITRQRAQLRDALIFEAHIREKRHIFVTKDRRAFISHGRREKFEKRYSTQIFTPDEFRAFLL